LLSETLTLQTNQRDEHRRKKPKAGTADGVDIDTPLAPDLTTSTSVIRTQRSPSESFIREVQRPLLEKRKEKEEEQLHELLKEGHIRVQMEHADR